MLNNKEYLNNKKSTEEKEESIFNKVALWVIAIILCIISIFGLVKGQRGNILSNEPQTNEKTAVKRLHQDTNGNMVSDNIFDFYYWQNNTSGAVISETMNETINISNSRNIGAKAKSSFQLVANKTYYFKYYSDIALNYTSFVVYYGNDIIASSAIGNLTYSYERNNNYNIWTFSVNQNLNASKFGSWVNNSNINVEVNNVGLYENNNVDFEPYGLTYYSESNYNQYGSNNYDSGYDSGIAQGSQNYVNGLMKGYLNTNDYETSGNYSNAITSIETLNDAIRLNIDSNYYPTSNVLYYDDVIQARYIRAKGGIIFSQGNYQYVPMYITNDNYLFVRGEYSRCYLNCVIINPITNQYNDTIASVTIHFEKANNYSSNYTYNSSNSSFDVRLTSPNGYYHFINFANDFKKDLNIEVLNVMFNELYFINDDNSTSYNLDWCTDLFSKGAQQYYADGYTIGYNIGFTDGGTYIVDKDYYGLSYEDIILNKYGGMTYEQILEIGKSIGRTENYNLSDDISNVVNMPFNFVGNMLNWEILGINVYAIFTGCVTLLLIVFIYRKLTK